MGNPGIGAAASHTPAAAPMMTHIAPHPTQSPPPHTHTYTNTCTPPASTPCPCCRADAAHPQRSGRHCGAAAGAPRRLPPGAALPPGHPRGAGAGRSLPAAARHRAPGALPFSDVGPACRSPACLRFVSPGRCSCGCGWQALLWLCCCSMQPRTTTTNGKPAPQDTLHCRRRGVCGFWQRPWPGTQAVVVHPLDCGAQCRSSPCPCS